MLLSSEAGPQRRHGGVAQPQNSTMESLTDITLLLTIDHTAQYSHASSKSMSLELLLVLRTLVGGAELRRTNGCSRTARARCTPSAGLRRRTAVGTSCAPLESAALASRW